MNIMYKNMKGLFLLTTVLLLIFAVTAVAATDDDAAGMTTDTPSIIDDTISTDLDTTVADNNNYINNNLQTKEVKKDSTTPTDSDDVDEIIPDENNNQCDDNYFDFQANEAKIKTSTVKNDQPDTQTFTITDDTYNQYFDEYGQLINTDVKSDATIILDGTFNSKSFVFTDVNVTIEGNNAVLNEGQILVFDQARVIIDNISFVNTNLNNSVKFDSDGNILRNSKITKTFTTALAREIYVTGNDNIIEYNTINITGPSAPINYTIQPSLSPVIAIAVLSSNNIIRYNNATYTDTRVGYDGSSDLISVNGALKNAENNLVTNNNLKATGSGYLYGLNLGVNANNNNLTYNTLNITSSYYSYGVNMLQVPMTNNKIEYNTMYLKADDTVYGMLANVWGAPEVSDFNINANNISTEAINAFGMQLAGSGYYSITFKNINITANNINVTGTYALGIGLSLTDNVYIHQNTLNINGQTNQTNTASWDTVQPTTAGVYSSNGNNTRICDELKYDVTNGPDVIFKSMTNSLIDGGTYVSNNDNFILDDVKNSNVTNTNANTTSKAGVDLISSQNNIIKSNVFVADGTFGNDAVVCDDASEANVIEDNLPQAIMEYSLKVDTTEFTVGQTNTITAGIYWGDEQSQQLATNISKGKVSFKVNGKTLKDANGKIIYAKIVNGTATIEDYEVPESWKDSTIQAVYSGCSDVDKLSSQKEEITITAAEPSITTEDVSTTVGGTVTLKATVTAAVPVNTGKVVFKINGKTVKDANGKVIYTKVADGQVSVEYTLPDEFKAGSYDLTAVFISSDYGKLEDVKTLTVN